jgi:hypothetical protein
MHTDGTENSGLVPGQPPLGESYTDPAEHDRALAALHGWLPNLIQVEPDSTGCFRARLRVTNTAPITRYARFLLTVLQNDRVIALISGTVHGVTAGRTVTVELDSCDQFAPQPWQIDLQVDYTCAD